MSELRILHVTPYFDQAWAYGGIPRVVSAQVQALAERGVRVTVATTDACDARTRLPGAQPHGPRPHQAVDRAGVEVRVFPNLSNRLAYSWQLFVPVGLGAYVARSAAGFAVAHLHGCHNLPGTIAARRLRQAGVPYVLQPNGTAPRIERRRVAKLVFDAIFGRHLLRDAARLVAVTETERLQLIRMGVDPSSVVVIPNPVDLREFADLPPRGTFRRRHGLRDGAMVLYLGQLSPRKRVDILVRAMAVREDATARLVVAGSDMGRGPKIRRLVASLGLEPRTLIPGVLQGKDRLAALVDADVVVYPSKDEIFGLVPLEALLCATPVVVSDDCGCGEVIHRTGGGQVVRYGDVAAVSMAIDRVLGDPDAWREPVARAAARVRQHFSAEVVSEQLQRLYDTLAARGRGAR